MPPDTNLDTSQPANPSPAPTQVTTPPPVQQDSKKRKTMMLAGLIAGGVVLLSGAGAGAYYGIVVPNKPENVLRESVANTLKQDQLSGKGSLNFTTSEEGAEPVIANFDVKSDEKANAFGMNLEVATAGIKLSLELRSFEKSAYVKVGDLASVKGAAAIYGPEAAALVDQVSAKVSNQWIEIDESLQKSLTKNDKCVGNVKISDQEIDQMLELYKKNQFASIKSTSDDKIDNKKVTKMVLDFDKGKAKNFGKDLKNIGFVKTLEECSKSVGGEDVEKNTEEFKGTTEFTIWVDKSKKKIAKLALVLKEDKDKATIDFTFNEDKVDIQKPEGAKPAMQVLGELSPLFQGLGLSSLMGGNPAGGDTDVSAQCAAAYEAWVNSGGTATVPQECMTE